MRLYRIRYLPGTALAQRYPAWTPWKVETFDGMVEAIIEGVGGSTVIEAQTQIIEPVEASYFSPAVLAKAAAAVENVGDPVDAASLCWHVLSSDGVTLHLVQVLGESGYITCTCQHGRHAGGHARCYHVAAVLAMNNLLAGIYAEDEGGGSDE